MDPRTNPSMDVRHELSAFLRSRRARLRPQDVGLRDLGGRRRVAGLRREEVAGLAGVSIAHYTRLEQGNSGSVSAEVLDAIGRALRLDADELTYLRRLARCGAGPRPGSVPDAGAGKPPRPGIRHLLDSFVTTPAILTGRYTEIVAWNPMCTAVFGDFTTLPPERRTISHLIFLEERVRRLHGDGWERAAREHVAHLRVLVGRYGGERALAAHVAELRAESDDFARMWAEHPVAQVRNRVYRLHHEIAGELELHGELLTLPGAPEYSGLDLFAAEPGSASDLALRRLAGSMTGRGSSAGSGASA
jgi:transcriptional regulator with XRE-family HTH domain